MAHHVFTRAALYARVWAEPMHTLAQGLGVSDVGLAKTCRAHQIPTPPRGYWARRQHGKPTPPPPPLAEAGPRGDRVVIAPAPPRAEPSPAVAAALAAGPDATIDVPSNLRRPHAIVQHWLDRNTELRRRGRENGWPLDEDLTTGLHERRLRLTSAILTALEARDLTVSDERTWLAARRGVDVIQFRLAERRRFEQQPASAQDRLWRPGRETVRVSVPAGDLMLTLRDAWIKPSVFREGARPLNLQLPAIVATIEAGLVDQAERRVERERLAAASARTEAERLERDAYRRAQAAQTLQLMDEAANFEQASQLRAYLAAADVAPMAQHSAYARWRAWAQAHVDTLDPLQGRTAPFPLLPSFEIWRSERNAR